MFCYCRTFNNIFNDIHFKTLKCQNILIICLNVLCIKSLNLDEELKILSALILKCIRLDFKEQ